MHANPSTLTPNPFTLIPQPSTSAGQAAVDQGRRERERERKRERESCGSRKKRSKQYSPVGMTIHGTGY